MFLYGFPVGQFSGAVFINEGKLSFDYLGLHVHEYPMELACRVRFVTSPDMILIKSYPWRCL